MKQFIKYLMKQMNKGKKNIIVAIIFFLKMWFSISNTTAFPMYVYKKQFNLLVKIYRPIFIIYCS